ncbi:uncharacterized protein LOC108588667 isoform X2 [Callithrix jacchus]
MSWCQGDLQKWYMEKHLQVYNVKISASYLPVLSDGQDHPYLFSYGDSNLHRLLDHLPYLLRVGFPVVQRIHVEVCYKGILPDAEVWSITEPITQVYNPP